MQPTTGGTAPLRIATYARVGSGRTGDQDSALRLQSARLKDFAERHNIQTVAAYTDLGIARSTPWQARPAARALTTAAFSASNDLDAVAIVDDPAHVFGPEGVAAALAALPVAIYHLSADYLTAVTADCLITRIASGISGRAAARPHRRALPYSARNP